MKTNLLKYLSVFAVASFLFLLSGYVTNAEASLSDPYSQDLNQIKFWAIDGATDNFPQDGKVYFSFTNFAGGTVQYSTNPDGSWTNLITPDDPTTISTFIPVNSEKEVIYLRLVNGNSENDSGTLVFSANTNNIGIDGYSTLSIYWNGLQNESKFSFGTALAPDAVAPVPIPASIWLLGAGLITITGIRRKNIEQEICSKD